MVNRRTDNTMTKTKMKNNDLTNDLQETKDWESRNPLKCRQRENWNNFFCRTVFFLAGLYSQYLNVLSISQGVKNAWVSL